MKNNTAMEFCNYIANLQLLSVAKANETGQDVDDGLLWHIESEWKGKSVLAMGHDIHVWQFEDNSIVLCDNNPSDFKNTEYIHVQYIGRMADGSVMTDWPEFWAGCTYRLSGYFKDGIYIEPESNPVEELQIQKESEGIEIKTFFTKMPETVSDPVVVRAEDFAQNPELAKAYLGQRKEDVKKFNEENPIKWEPNYTTPSNDKASLYNKGQIIRATSQIQKEYGLWGMLHWNDKQRPSVEFKTEECFTAFVLAKFW